MHIKDHTRPLIALVFFLLGGPSGWAANYSNPINGVFKGIYGDAISVEVPSLVSKSPVTNEDENGDLLFQFNANTNYRNFNQLTDLKKGDPVRVDYSENPASKGKQMVANTITKLDSVVVANPVIVNTDAASVPTVTQTVTTTTTTKVDSQ